MTDAPTDASTDTDAGAHTGSGDTRQTPRFVGDAPRSYLAVGVAVVVSLAFSFGYGFVAPDLAEDPDKATRIQLVNILFTYVLLLLIYQLATWLRFRAVDGETLMEWARATNPRGRLSRLRTVLLGTGGRSWSTTAAVVAMGAVLLMAVLDIARSDALVVGLSLALVAVAWTMVVVASAVSYLREYADNGGLEFPDDTTAPTWTDLFYLAVQVSTTFSSSDIDVTSRRMRRLVTSQSLVSFVFNTVIVALLVSTVITLAA